jgi:DNA-binding MarR family transcriptional regulator
MTSLLNAAVSSQLLIDNPILSLSAKITESAIRQLNDNLQSYSITTEHWVAMKLVDAGSAKYPSELSQLMGISAPRITKIIDHLERKQLITRGSNKEDRRKFTILLSTKGKNLLKKAVKIESITPLLDKSSLNQAEMPLYNYYLKKAS